MCLELCGPLRLQVSFESSDCRSGAERWPSKRTEKYTNGRQSGVRQQIVSGGISKRRSY